MRDRRLSVLAVLLSSIAAAFILVRGGASAGQPPADSAKARLARGAYLVHAGGCHDCHTPKIFTAKGPEPDMARALSGVPAGAKVPPVPSGVISPAGWGALASNDMTVWAGPWGVSFAANITPDKTTGIGAWTEAAFVNSIRTGKHKGALRDILPPMPWQSMSKLTDEDLKALFAYLMSIKPIQNKVPDPRPPGH